MERNRCIPSPSAGGTWDVLVVGTGMGGATLGYALARAGWRVLFLEKGRSHLGDGEALRGDYAEQFFSRREAPQPKHREILARAGRWAEEIEDLSGPRPRRFLPFIGSGTGGSSALYGMAMERLSRENLRPRDGFPQAQGSTLPERWPIDYDELCPYYEAAERLFGVRGEHDPLLNAAGYAPAPPLPAPPPLEPVNRELFAFLNARGLRPYRLPMACDYERGHDRSQGFLDATGGKNDSAKICLAPALESFGAGLLQECEVLSLEATRRRVTGVHCLHRGTALTLRAPLIVLAAGALATPRILLGSASPLWPDGLANDSGLVGCNLMRHFVDLYAIYPQTPGPFLGNLKQIAFSAVLPETGQKAGTVQSFGPLPEPRQAAAGMEQEMLDLGRPWAARVVRWARPALHRYLSRLATRTLVLASLMEDLPYLQNRVTLAEESVSRGSRQLRIRYRISAHDLVRIRAFRAGIASALRPYRFTRVGLAESNTHLAHVCGTCRFGTDPARSVLDAENRAHGIENLYVVDASFFPSSGGANPGLTLAANALRVAEILTRQGLHESRLQAALPELRPAVPSGQG